MGSYEARFGKNRVMMVRFPLEETPAVEFWFTCLLTTVLSLCLSLVLRLLSGFTFIFQTSFLIHFPQVLCLICIVLVIEEGEKKDSQI